MSTKELLATVAGFATLFLVGFLIYVVALADFFAANVGSATGVMRDPPLVWAIALGDMAAAVLLTVVLGRWAGVRGAGAGARAGALVGLLLTATFDLIIYGTTNVSTLTGVAADIGIGGILYGLAGAAVGAVLASGASR